MAQNAPAASVLAAGLKARCPRCGQGALFTRGLALRETCERCGLSYAFADSGDGPAVFAIFILGSWCSAARCSSSSSCSPPVWVHVVLWGILTPLLAFFLLARPQGDADRPAVQAQGRAGPLRLGLSDTPCWQRLKRAGLIWPTAFALAGLAVLVGLGTWQLQRKHWKEALIAKIAARVKAEPVPLAVALAQLRGGRRRRVPARRGTRPLPPRQGALSLRARQVGPRLARLYAAGVGAAGSIVWVNRGFVPDARKSPQARPGGASARARSRYAGLVRLPPQPGLFTPAERCRPQPLVLAGRCRHDGVRLRRRSRSRHAPVTIDADARPDPGAAAAAGGVTRLDLPNRHLEYALTWYGLALTLIGVYAAFAAGLAASGA